MSAPDPDPSPRPRFVETHWSLVRRAGSGDGAQARAALDELYRTYWWPLYAYARRRGRTKDDAAELVQGLFAELIEKGRFAHADPGRGRFRSWLLGALQNHMAHEADRAHAAKRGGTHRAVPIDLAQAESRWEALVVVDADPERTYDRAWALQVIERAFANVEADYARRGHASEFHALSAQLAPDGGEAPTPNEAAAHGPASTRDRSAAKRLRQRIREAIVAEIRSTLGSEDEVADERRLLFDALGPGR